MPRKRSFETLGLPSRPERDAFYLEVMRKNCEDIVFDVGQASLQKYLRHRLLHNATSMLLVDIGEKANRVSAEARQFYPDIPWNEVVELRHVITHDYGSLTRLQVHTIATTLVPALLESLGKSR